MRLQFGVPADLAGAEYDLSVFDLVGRRVTTVERGQATAGHHAVTWNLRSQDGSRVARGMYFVRLQVGPTKLTQRFISVR
jgi:flagellar hook assembly protein FlgD